MADRCHTGQYWDALISRCMDCDIECQRQHVIPRCTSYCGEYTLTQTGIQIHGWFTVCEVKSSQENVFMGFCGLLVLHVGLVCYLVMLHVLR